MHAILTLFSLFMIGCAAFLVFCIYCGIETILDSLKKNGLFKTLEYAFLIYMAAGAMVLISAKVTDAIFRKEIPISNSRDLNI